MKRRRLSAMLVTSFVLASAQQPGPAAPDGILIGPLTFTNPVNGVPVAAAARSLLTVNTTGGNLNVGLSSTVNLVDLQRKFPQIVGTFPLPRDNCRSFSPNNPVVSLDGRALRLQGNQAVLDLSGNVVMWHCLENPIPEVYWDSKCGLFGCPRTRKGSPIKNKIGSQSFEASVPITLAPVSGNTVAAVIGTPSIKLSGKYVFITQGILQLADVNINELAKKAIDQAVDPSKLKLSVPPEYLKLNPEITEARFVESEGALGVRMAMTARISQSTANDFVQLLVKTLVK